MLILIIAIVLLLGFIIFASFAEGIEMHERFIIPAKINAILQTPDSIIPKEEKKSIVSMLNDKSKRYNALWHTHQMLERIALLLGSFLLGLSQFQIFTKLAVIFLIAVTFKTVYDGVINVYLEREFFHISSTTTSTLEKLTPKWVKLTLIAIGIMLIIVSLL